MCEMHFQLMMSSEEGHDPLEVEGHLYMTWKG